MMMNSSNRNGPVKNEILMVPQQAVTTTQLIPQQYHSQNTNILQPQLYQTQQPQHFQQQYYQTANVQTIPQQPVQQNAVPNVAYNNNNTGNMSQSQRPSTVQLPPIKDLLYTKSYTPTEQQQQQNTSVAATSTNTGSPLGNGIPPTPINNNNNSNNNYTTVARDTAIHNINNTMQPITTFGSTSDAINSFTTTNTASNVAGPTTNTNTNNAITVPTFQDAQFLNRLVIEYNKLSTELNCLRSESKFENKSLPSLYQLTQQIPNSVDHIKNNNNNIIQNGQSPIINPILSTANTHNIHGNPMELNNSGSYYIQKANSYPHSPLTPPMSLYSVQQHPIKQQHQHPSLRTNDDNNTLYTAETLCSMIKNPKRKILKKRVYNKKKKNVRLIKCFHCGEVQTPEWRRGPYGNRTLCNACGLYYRKLIKRFDTKNANLIMRFNKLINPMDRRIPLNVNVPNNIIEKFNNDETLDSDYYSIKESI